MNYNGQPYTDFKAINANDGKIRIADEDRSTTDYSVELTVAPSVTQGSRTVYVKDVNGSMMLCGYHVTYGTTTIQCSSNIAANGIATTSCSISGLLTTSYILINAETSAEVAGFVPFGATCQAAGKAIIQYYVGAATTSVATVPISYIYFQPQTS